MNQEEVWKEFGGTSKEKEVPPKPSYNSIELAKYFQDKFIGAEWHSGFGMVNVQILSAQFAKWKSRTDAATVRAMIDLYMTDVTMRGKNPGWKDFLAHAEQINAKLTLKPVKSEWDIIREEWERENGVT